MKMNKLLTTWLFVLIALWAKAQDFKMNTDSTTVTILQQDEPSENDLRITHMYAWAYCIGTADDQTLKDGSMSTFWNIRAWGAGQRDVTDNLSAKSVVAYDLSSDWSDEQGKFIHTWWMQYMPTAWTTISVGKTPTAGTLMIANPVTAWGHLLFTAESQVPFPWVGTRVDQKIWEGSVSAWWIVRPWGVEWSVFGSYWPFSWALVLDPVTGKLNWWISYITDLTSGANIFSMVWLHPDALSYSAMFTTSNKVGIFADGQRNLEDKDLYNVQVGALKSAKVWDVSAKLWVAWNIEWTQAHWTVFTMRTVLFLTLGWAR